MFDSTNEMFLQLNSSFKNPGRKYVILTNREEIGSIQNMKGTSINLGNILLNLIGWHSGISLNYELVNEQNELLGYLRKQMGIRSKDLHLFRADQSWVASVRTHAKLKDPSISVMGANDEELIKCEWRTSGIDYSLTDVKNNQPIGTIRKRSMVYESVKENLMNADGYYIPVLNEAEKTLMMIGIGISIDLYYSN
ncbi:hypothetical protein E3U55_06415 [Filobacillus milosensis]|uniref:Uncharacterized protein n=1 Tax=Filobacillus milosensis TaxID=94137 RepID=A0A4Y8IUU1_9BACI|nr:hypothetical protein [Filobacillus milosensis]TFB22868.1 hypothetical protein E3U55_06415 [Filobacillus milosensis]